MRIDRTTAFHHVHATVVAVVLAGASLPSAHANCSSIRDDDRSTESSEVHNSPVADRVIKSWRLTRTAGFGGCWTNVGHEVVFTPAATGLTYVRDVQYIGRSFPAYQWGPSTPLVLLRLEAGTEWEPVRLDAPTSVRTNTLNGDIPVALRYMLVARGGPMAITTPLVVAGSTRHRYAAALGQVQHRSDASLSLRQMTCSLADTNLVMDDIALSALPAVGSTSASRTITVNMTCPLDGPDVEFSLNDAGDASNRGSVLTPAPNTTAAGVAVQMLRGGAPVQFGQTWRITPTATTTRVSFGARYHRTAVKAEPGVVEGIATLVATYY